MIPKKIYFFWGNEKMSWMRYMTLKSFRIFNPDWEIILYISPCPLRIKTWQTSENQDYFNFEGIDYMPEIEKLDVKIQPWDLSDNGIIQMENNPDIGASHKSNFFKWSKLALDEGIYSDLDILYFRPVDSFWQTLNDGNYDTAICQTEYLSIGLLASTGSNDFFKDIFLNSINRYTGGEYQSAGVISIYDFYNKIDNQEEIEALIREKYPQFNYYKLRFYCDESKILSLAQERYPSMRFYNIPMNLIYPFNHKEVERIFNENLSIKDLPSETIGYHWYAGHSIAQNYNNILQESNYGNYVFLFTNIVKEICGT